MRKQTKIAALVSAAALFAIGASMTSFAYGWNYNGYEWEWLDHDDNRVTECWKSSNGQYYWLDENGVMATNQIVEDGEDVYYVLSDGRRATNQWVSVDNDESVSVGNTDAFVDTLWYYFGATGKAIKASNASNGQQVKTVPYQGTNQKFVFDDFGHMVSGWADIDGEYYYLGDENDGVVRTGWQYLEPAEFMTGSDYNDQEWFYFGTSGKASRAKDLTDYVSGKTQYIDGKYYVFNQDGVLQGDWFETTTLVTTASVDAAGKYTIVDAYANIYGSRTGWVYAEKTDKVGDYAWYYLVSANGYKSVPFNLRNKVSIDTPDAIDNGTAAYGAKVINGKTYLFNASGEMQTGVKNIVTPGAADYDSDKQIIVSNVWYLDNRKQPTTMKDLPAGIYYFSKAAASQGSDGRMMTGKQTVDVDGENYYYHFQANGQAYVNTIKDGILYDKDGLRVQAEDGNTYEAVSLGDVRFSGNITVSGATKKSLDSSVTVIVNRSGRLRKNTTVTIEGTKWKVDGDYKATQIQ